MSDIVEKSNFAVLCDACDFFGLEVELQTITKKPPHKLKIVVLDEKKHVMGTKTQSKPGVPKLEYMAEKLALELEERGLFDGEPEGV